MKIVQQDMLRLERGILFHQVNCEGVMGGGIAAALARQYPGLEEEYRQFCEDECHLDAAAVCSLAWERDPLLGHTLLGKVQVFTVLHRQLYIANVFGQTLCSNKTRLTNYEAVAQALECFKKAQELNPRGILSCLSDELYFPFKMGCGLGGGEWTIYSAIIEHYFPNAIICKHE
jgi:O-acetyl-ADP-ribose deacetylase (regulator of RNase III)